MPVLTNIMLSAPGDPADLDSFLATALQFRHRPRLIRLGFALAKRSGVDALAAAVSDQLEWDRARKEWLIGIQFGLTEPEALHRLLNMPGSVVRLHGWWPAAAQHHGMFRVGNFHPKVIASGAVDISRVTAMFIGSANLTGAALGAVPMNYEAGISVVSRAMPPALVAPFNGWWRRAWHESSELTHPLIDEYARTRENVLEQNPDLRQLLEAEAREGAEFGEVLWIEAGAMSGGARNQVEFAEDLVPFFGPPTAGRRLLRIRRGDEVWSDRPLSHKMTTFGVHIWRLSLPTEASGGFDYVGRVIWFRRSKDADGLIFDLDVVDAGSPKAQQWRRDSEARGHVGLTGSGGRGGREYGLV